MIDPMRLYKRGNKYYCEFGRGKSKSLGTGNQEEAKAIFRELKKEYLTGKLIQLDKFSRLTLAEWKSSYLESRTGMSSMTIKKDVSSLGLFIDVAGSSTALRSVSPKSIEDFKKVCLGRDASPQGINSYLRHIKAALHWAVDSGYIDKVPKIKMLKEEETGTRILSPGEITLLLSKALESDIWFWRYLTFQLWTGARRTETLNLEWQRINFAKRECLLTKTKAKRDRTVPLMPAVIEVLEPVKKDLGKVFPQYHPDWYTHKFKELARACGIEDIHLHDIRHSAATYMLKSGMAIQVVSKILGHSQLSTTMIYTHVLDDIKQKEMQKYEIR